MELVAAASASVRQDGGFEQLGKLAILISFLESHGSVNRDIYAVQLAVLVLRRTPSSAHIHAIS